MDFQAWVDEWADCVLNGDDDAFVAKMQFPFNMDTTHGSWVVETPEQAISGMIEYRKHITEIGANVIVRSIGHIERHSEDSASLTVTNHILRNGQRLQAPTSSIFYMRKTGDQWKSFGLKDFPDDVGSGSHLPAVNLAEMHVRARKNLKNASTSEAGEDR